jgi:hypothetical protein
VFISQVVKTVVIHLVSFQLLFSNIVLAKTRTISKTKKRTPSSQSHKVSIRDLNRIIEEFKAKLVTTDVLSCSNISFKKAPSLEETTYEDYENSKKIKEKSKRTPQSGDEEKTFSFEYYKKLRGLGDDEELTAPDAGASHGSTSQGNIISTNRLRFEMLRKLRHVKFNICGSLELDPEYDSESYMDDINFESMDDEAFVLFKKKKNFTPLKKKNRAPAEKSMAELFPELECRKIKQTGLISKLIKSKKIEDESRAPLKAFSKDDPVVKGLYKKALLIKDEVIRYMIDADVDEGARKGLVIHYLAAVVMPMKDFIILKKNYLPGEFNGDSFINTLLPVIPSDLFPKPIPGDYTEEPKIGYFLLTQGPDALENFSLSIVERSDLDLELEFAHTVLGDRKTVITRDLTTLLKAPSHRTYTRSLKWMTLGMMISQIQLFKEMSQDQSDFVVPPVCRSGINANLPAQLSMKHQIDPTNPNKRVDEFLEKFGLIYSDDNTLYEDYYVANHDRDPTKMNYSGLIPFQDYENTRYANLDEDNVKKTDIDDYFHFPDVIKILQRKAQTAFSKKVVVYEGKKVFQDRKTVKIKGEDLFNKILGLPKKTDIYQIDREIDGETVHHQTRLANGNYSTYIIERKTRESKERVEELFTKRILKKFRGKKILIDFPSLYGANIHRSWAFKQLALMAKRFGVDGEKIPERLGLISRRICKTALQTAIEGDSFYKMCVRKNWFQTGLYSPKVFLAKLYDFLKDHIRKKEYTPLRRIIEKDYEPLRYAFTTLWNKFREDESMLPNASMDELQYLMQQYHAKNPWARVRVGYLLLEDELFMARQGIKPKSTRVVRTNTYWDYPSQCLFNDANEKLKSVRKAAKLMGIDKPLVPNYGNVLLNEDQKVAFWRVQLDKIQEKSLSLLTVKNNRDVEYYKKMSKIAASTILTRKDVDNAVEKHSLHLNSEEKEQLDYFFETDTHKFSKFFRNLYDERDFKKQQKKVEDFYKTVLKENQEIKDLSKSPLSIKLKWLTHDNYIKTILLRNLMRTMAGIRIAEIQTAMDKLCNLDLTDHRSFFSLFHITSKNQNAINEIAGIDEVPPDLLDKLDSFSPDEWDDLWLGIGSAVLAMGSVFLGGACVFMSGGACAPIAATVIAGSLGGLGIQVALVPREIKRKRAFDELESLASDMYDMGLTKKESVTTIHRGWGYVALESFFIIPLLGIVARGLTTGVKLLGVSTRQAYRSIVGDVSPTTFKSEVRRVLAEADVRLASRVIQLTKFGDEWRPFGSRIEKLWAALNKDITKEELARVKDKHKKIMALLAEGKITKSDLVKALSDLYKPYSHFLKDVKDADIFHMGMIRVLHDLKEIDVNTAKTLVTYWGDSVEDFARLIESFVEKRGAKAVAIQRKLRNKEYFASNHSLGGLGNLLNWYRNIRTENLAIHASKLKMILREIRRTKNNPDFDFEKFLLKHMDPLTDFFSRVPFRKREIPYIGMLKGGVHIGGALRGRRIPLVYGGADASMMHKIFNARARLSLESLKAQAREVLGIQTYVAMEAMQDLFFALRSSVDSQLRNSSDEAFKETLLAQYKEMEGNIARGLYEKYMAKYGERKLIYLGRRKLMNVSVEDFYRYVFKPENKHEMALGKTLWGLMEPQDFFELAPKANEMAYKLARRLQNYDGTDQFQQYVNALKILAIQKNLNIVDVM